MRAAVALRNVVGEAEHVLVVGVVPPHRAFHRNAVFLGADHYRPGNERRFVTVEELHEGLDTALVFHFLALLDGVARVDQDNRDAGIQERQLAQAMLQRREIELHHGEGFRRRQKRHFGAALAVGIADHRQRRHRRAVAELDEMLLAVAPDAQLEPGRQRVDDGDADAMQAA